MTKSKIITLQCRCIEHERNATTVERRKYWAQQFRHLNALARRIGWID